MGCSSSSSKVYLETMDDIIDDIKQQCQENEEFTWEKIEEFRREILMRLQKVQKEEVHGIDKKVMSFNRNGDSKTEKKKVIVFVDGAGNPLFPNNPTNITLLYKLLSNGLEKVEENIVMKYFPGVVNKENLNQTSPDEAFAAGVDVLVANILDYIYSTYFEGDEIIFFGLGRGSFIVRIVCNVLRWYGIPRKEEEPNQIFAKFKTISKNTEDRTKILTQSDKNKYITPIILFVGLYDTVMACDSSFAKSLDLFFHIEDSQPIIQSVLHIMADRCITSFQQVSYFSNDGGGINRCLENAPSKDLFSIQYKPGQFLEYRHAGSHLNIGGGILDNPERDQSISNNTLRLMLLASPFHHLVESLLPTAQSATYYPSVTTKEEYLFNPLNKKDMGEKQEDLRRLFCMIEDLTPNKKEMKKMDVNFVCKKLLP